MWALEISSHGDVDASLRMRGPQRWRGNASGVFTLGGVQNHSFTIVGNTTDINQHLHSLKFKLDHRLGRTANDRLIAIRCVIATGSETSQSSLQSSSSHASVNMTKCECGAGSH